MKKVFYIFTILIISALALCFSACGKKEEEQEQIIPEPEKYVVTYYDGEAVLETRTVEKGGEIPALAPTKDGNRFAGWFLADGSSISGVTVQADISVYARWNKLYSVTFRYGKGIPEEKVEAVAGESITLPEFEKAEDGTALIYWTDGLKEYKPASIFVMPSVNVVLDAEWAVLVTVTYCYNGEEVAVQVAKGATVTLPDDILSADGKTV